MENRKDASPEMTVSLAGEYKFSIVVFEAAAPRLQSIYEISSLSFSLVTFSFGDLEAPSNQARSFLTVKL